MNWRLNRIQYPIYNLGPGKRIGIWVQGCSIRCEGCVSKTLWAVDGGRNIDVLELAEKIISVKEYYNGLTISGGEPFDQYEFLITFCAFIKKMTKLNIYCYSGYTIDELSRMHPDRLFIQYMDGSSGKFVGKAKEEGRGKRKVEKE